MYCILQKLKQQCELVVVSLNDDTSKECSYYLSTYLPREIYQEATEQRTYSFQV